MKTNQERNRLNINRIKYMRAKIFEIVKGTVNFQSTKGL